MRRFRALTKIRHLQNHGLVPRLLAQNRPVSDSWEFTRNYCEQASKQLEVHFQACRRSFREFETISGTYKNPPSSKPWPSAQAFSSKSAGSNPWEFTRNYCEQASKQLEVHFQACRRSFREFETISGTYQNPPSSKPWPRAQAFSSKSAGFGPLGFTRNYCEQASKQLEVHFQACRRSCREFETISGTY